MQPPVYILPPLRRPEPRWLTVIRSKWPEAVTLALAIAALALLLADPTPAAPVEAPVPPAKGRTP